MPGARRITPADENFVHGFFVVPPWDDEERLHIVHRLPFSDHMPDPGDEAVVGVIDTHNDDTFVPLATTTAWNFKLGAMAHWIPGRDRTIVFNTYDGTGYRGRILSVDDGDNELIAHPVFTVSRDGRYGFGHNFARVHELRPGYGYYAHGTPTPMPIAPDDDGLFRVSLDTGEAKLLVSFAELAADYCPANLDQPLLIGRSLTNWSSTRLLISFRYHNPSDDTWPTAIVTMDLDGGDRHLLCDFEAVPKHFDWFDDDRLWLWATWPDTGRGFHLVTDRTGHREPVARGSLAVDGHLSRRVGGGPILTDTFPDEDRLQHLYLYGPESQKAVHLGSWDSPWMGSMDLRCDLDPSWSPSGRFVTFNSLHEGFRGVYLIDVADIPLT